jgi:hypothetical protein
MKPMPVSRTACRFWAGMNFLLLVPRLAMASYGSVPFTAGCAPLPDGEASPDYLRRLVAVHARQAPGEAFASAT